jgi:hypothetical protein
MSILGSNDVAHFFEGRLLCGKCYTPMKESAMKTHRDAEDDVLPGGPLDLSSIPDSYHSNAPITTMKFKGVVITIGMITLTALLAAIIVYYSGFTDRMVSPEEISIYADDDVLYLRQAYQYAKKEVVRDQRIPTKAQWPAMDEIESFVTYLEDGRYQVEAWYDLPIDNKRIFRQYYIAVLLRSGDMWEMESLQYFSENK